MTDINEARKKINEYDREMAKLFEKRMEAVREIALCKKESGLPIKDSSRENEILFRNCEFISDDTLREFYVTFLQNSLEVSRNYQRRLLTEQRIAYSGVPGAFADIASHKIFPDGTSKSYPDFRTAYEAVENGECDCALLPIENSYNGDVGQVMDLAYFGPLFVNGVYQVEIVQNLLAVPGTSIDEVQRVMSHPQALGQCALYIQKHGFEPVACVNTAIAAETVARENRHDTAAIGSEEAAGRYGLQILESHINASSKNTTRFAVFSRARKTPALNDNCFIMLFTVKNEPGCLGKAISTIGENGFNLRALKSRPTKELSWSYYFYAEGEGRIDSFEGRRMLAALAPNCMDVKILGSFEKEIMV